MGENSGEVPPRIQILQKQKQIQRAVTEARKKRIWDYIVDNDMLFSYVRDKYGFRKGVVIANGPGQIGWSLVSTEDYDDLFLPIEQIPILASYLSIPEEYLDSGASIGDALDGLVRSEAFQAWQQNGTVVSRPKFDKIDGCRRAIESLLANADAFPDVGMSFEEVPLPFDKDLRDEVLKMIDRSHRYYKDHPNAFKTANSQPTSTSNSSDDRLDAIERRLNALEEESGD